MSFEHTIPNHRTSPWFIAVDGQNISYASTGTRLLVSLFMMMADNRFRYVLVDEPEQGLSPILQSRIADILFVDEKRRELFPSLEGLFLATHSHLLLDRRCLTNNFIVTKTDAAISASQIHTTNEFHELQFTMLGNSLESVFMPSAIVMVEGITDQLFLNKVLQLRCPDRHLTVVRGGSDGEISQKLHTLKEAIGDLNRSPYYDRIFVILDATHSAKHSKIANQGIKGENIIVWSKNGVEYLYPPRLLKAIFHCSDDELSKMVCENETVRVGVNVLKKTDVARQVVDGLLPNDTYPDELEQFLARL